MKYQIFTIFDTVANIYGTPYAGQNKGQVYRQFIDEINRPDDNNQFYKHPDDFRLCYLGTFDDETATYELLSQPETCLTGSAVKLK